MRLAPQFIALAVLLALVAPRSLAVAPDGIGEVPEAEQYSLIYEFDVPHSTSALNSGISYSVDNSSTFTGPFDRVAYYLELQGSGGTRWVWVSMDSFTGDPEKLGVPGAAAAIFWHRPVHNLNIYSNVAGVATGEGIDTGILEFWPSGYSATNDSFANNASDALYDWGDGGASFDAGYGSMQVLNTDADGAGPGFAGQTIFAYNAWGQAGYADDLGIGNGPGDNPDWTFAGGSRDYTARLLQVYVRPSPVRFTALPQFRQLFARNGATNEAVAPLAGEVTEAGYDAALARVYRDGALADTLSQPLVYSGGKAAFSFSPSIPAELANYDVELSLKSGGVERYVHRARNLVAGDAYIVQGQSNAAAAQVSGDANVNRSEFVRSFGSASALATGVPTTNDRTWYVANGNTANAAGSVGQWAARLGRRIVDDAGVPVAILNGALGGQPIGYFQRNDADPGDLSTNYGRLLNRMQAAGLPSGPRAILWHQGESDVDNAAGHESGWTALHEDWLADYPETEETYNHQVRDGCGPPSIQLRDAQRRFQDNIADVTAMSTTAIDGHDGCHYAYENGYKLIGDHLADVILRDLYGRPDAPNLLPPNPQAAYWGNSGRTEVRLVMRNKADGLVWDAGAEADVKLEGAGVTATGAVVSGNTLRISLSGDGSATTGITYDGHTGAGPWIRNLRGVGVLEFYSVPITAAPAATAPNVTASPSDGGLTLTWPPSYANCGYEVYRGEAPYFSPEGSAPITSTLPAGSAGYADAASGLGDAETNHFYVVQAGNCDATSNAASNRVGEFDFALR
jgi:hypothetical protein